MGLFIGINMADYFRPGIWKSGSFTPPSGVSGRTEAINSGQMFWLPKPVLNMPYNVEAKYHKEEPIRKTGATAVYGLRATSTIITITGEVTRATVGGTEAQVEYDWDSVMVLTDLSAFFFTETPLELFYHYDSGAGKYFKLKKCHRRSLTWDVGDKTIPRVPWTLQMEVLDPNIYLTAPGV